MESDYLPINYLNHLNYCPRRFWLMYVQGEISVNAPMLEGSLQHHKRADVAGRETDDRSREVQRKVWVWSDRLKIAGIADFVESNSADGPLIPVEYKHGHQGKWDNDQIQLCAQALCLEEMLNTQIDHGEIYYWRSRRRITIQLDAEVRQKTVSAIDQAFHLLTQGQIPKPVPETEKHKCQHCSMEPICLPAELRQLENSPANL
jgi:CRISPR-associated exonuclease Cas4